MLIIFFPLQVLSCPSVSDQQRWLEAMRPPEAETPGEKLYESWDCPQVIAKHSYESDEPDVLQLEVGDVVNVSRKLPDGECNFWNCILVPTNLFAIFLCRLVPGRAHTRWSPWLVSGQLHRGAQFVACTFPQSEAASSPARLHGHLPGVAEGQVSEAAVHPQSHLQFTPR